MIRHILLATTLLTLVAPDLALAQSREGRPDGGQRPGGGQRPSGPTTRPAPGNTGGPQIQPVRPGRPGGDGGSQIRPPRPQPPQGGRPDRPGGPNRPGIPNRPNPGRPPHRPGVGRPPQFRPQPGRPFRYPHGYRYRRWSIGLLLPGLFLSSAYYYDNYGALGVDSPPPGYRWVRYGPDLLLVDVRTRRIADVIHGAFY